MYIIPTVAVLFLFTLMLTFHVQGKILYGNLSKKQKQNKYKQMNANEASSSSGTIVTQVQLLYFAL